MVLRAKKRQNYSDSFHSKHGGLVCYSLCKRSLFPQRKRMKVWSRTNSQNVTQKERWLKPNLVLVTHRIVKARISAFLFGNLRSQLQQGGGLSLGPRISSGGHLQRMDPLIVVAMAAACEETWPSGGGRYRIRTTNLIGKSTLRCSWTSGGLKGQQCSCDVHKSFIFHLLLVWPWLHLTDWQ